MEPRMTADLKPAQRILAEIEEATRRAETQYARQKAQGHDHFRETLAMAHERLDEDSLDRFTAHAKALASV